MATYDDDLPANFYDNETVAGKLKDALAIEKLKANLAAQTAAAFDVPITKKVEQSGLVHDDIKQGMHVRLKCGCEGFVKEIGHSDVRDERWFSVLNTKTGCRSLTGIISLEMLYAEKPGQVKLDTYHSDTFSRVLPAFEVPAPSWFKSIKDVPKSANERRAVRVRLLDMTDFVIPGALMNIGVYAMATTLREMFKGTRADIEVIENVDGIDSDNLGKAPEFFKKLCEAKNQTFEEKNISIFYNWLISLLYNTAEGETITEMGTSALSRDSLRIVLASAAKHPMWKGSKVEITSKEGYVVILDSNAKVS